MYRQYIHTQLFDQQADRKEGEKNGGDVCRYECRVRFGGQGGVDKGYEGKRVRKGWW